MTTFGISIDSSHGVSSSRVPRFSVDIARAQSNCFVVVQPSVSWLRCCLFYFHFTLFPPHIHSLSPCSILIFTLSRTFSSFRKIRSLFIELGKRDSPLLLSRSTNVLQLTCVTCAALSNFLKGIVECRVDFSYWFSAEYKGLNSELMRVVSRTDIRITSQSKTMWWQCQDNREPEVHNQNSQLTWVSTQKLSRVNNSFQIQLYCEFNLSAGRVSRIAASTQSSRYTREQINRNNERRAAE